MTPEEIKAWVWAKCHEDGDCLLWDGAVANGGVPTARDPNTEKLSPARRILLTAMGKNVAGKVATTTCNNPLCMAEDHVVAWTRKQLQQRSGEKLTYNMVRAKKLADVARRQSTVDMDLVRQIRAAGMRPKQAAEHFNVPFQTACRIISGTSWKEYGTNPFIGLGARAANDSKRRAA